MFSSLNSSRLFSIRSPFVWLLTIGIIQLSFITVTAQDSGGPKFVKPSIPKGNSKSGEKSKSSTKTTRTVNKKKEHPLAPALKIAKSSLNSMGEIKDYQAIFFKTELVKNRYINHQVRLKFRESPFSVYMGFDGAHKGREVLYVAGKNNGKLIAKEAGAFGIVGGVSLNPTSPTAMAESKYPITDIGMKNLVTKLIAQWERETKYGECEVKIYNGSLPVKSTNTKIKCKVIDSKHPRRRKQFDYHHTRLIVARESNLPISVEQYAFPSAQGKKARLVGKYVYVNVKTDVGFKDIDFDVNNRQYRFR